KKAIPNVFSSGTTHQLIRTGKTLTLQDVIGEQVVLQIIVVEWHRLPGEEYPYAKSLRCGLDHSAVDLPTGHNPCRGVRRFGAAVLRLRFAHEIPHHPSERQT